MDAPDQISATEPLEAPPEYSFDKVVALYETLKDERSEWESDWRSISDYLIPGRGIFQTYSKPRKRKLTSPFVINTIGEDSLYVLTSAMHGRLTSPAMPWFSLSWTNKALAEHPQLKAWLQESSDILNAALHASDFYSVIDSFYVEYSGFGTGCLYVGEDTDDDDIPFNFQLLTAGEYAFSLGPDGRTCVFCRTIYMSPRQLFLRFPDTVSDELRKKVKANEAGIDKVDLAVLEFVAKEKYQDKEYIRLFYEVTGTGSKTENMQLHQSPLEITGFYENPYPAARWSTIGSDTYGIGPGSRAIPDIKRLQEMEKSFLMATHKSIDPPLNVPARMRGKLNTLPGGHNFYANPNEKIEKIYDNALFDYQGVSAAIERVEQRIQRNFFNDVFLTTMRDPNASPLRTGQVNAQKQEELFRLGPVTQRLQSELLTPVLKRSFNILRRKDKLPPIDPQLLAAAGDFSIDIVSPMAVAQRSVKSQGTDRLMGFIAQAAQFDQTILDNLDGDAAVNQRAEIEGVDVDILRTPDTVESIRKNRAALLKQKEDAEKQEKQAALQSQLDGDAAAASKDQAAAAQILADTQLTSQTVIQ